MSFVLLKKYIFLIVTHLLSIDKNTYHIYAHILKASIDLQARYVKFCVRDSKLKKKFRINI